MPPPITAMDEDEMLDQLKSGENTQKLQKVV